MANVPVTGEGDGRVVMRMRLEQSDRMNEAGQTPDLESATTETNQKNAVAPIGRMRRLSFIEIPRDYSALSRSDT